MEKKNGCNDYVHGREIDVGDIITQRAISIEDEDNTGTMFEKLSVVGRELLKETLPIIIEGKNERIPQDEEKVTFAHNISREQERVDWSNGARNVFNQVRGLTPWPTAYTTFQGENVKLWSVKEGDSVTTHTPGQIVKIENDSFEVATGDGKSIVIYELQPAGKKRMTAQDYLRGTGSKLAIGDQFE